MIISKTPFRVALFGGGTDFESYFREHGGEVFGFAIDKFAYISLRKLPPFFDYKHRIVYSEIELTESVDEIRHPVVRAVLNLEGIKTGMSIHHDGDLPARSGLGSSSSFAVGLLNAVHAFKGNAATDEALAKEAIHVEREVLSESGGWQDQVWAAYGGMRHIRFHQDGTFDAAHVVLREERKQELLGSLMLFFTGFSRYSSGIAHRQVANLAQRQRQLQEIRAMVPHALSVLGSNGSLDEIGHTLHASWRLKKEMAEGISNAAIDEIYDAARAAGALGGKLLGAGGGGFMLLYVPRQYQGLVRAALEKLVNVSFGIASEGSKIVVYQPNGL